MKKNDETKLMSIDFDVKGISEQGGFEGYASVFDILDNQKDIMLNGAFARTLKEKGASGIKLLWQHKFDEPIGRFSVIREDLHGLYVEGNLAMETQKGREAYVLLKSGAINGLSIGYSVIEAGFDEETGVRYIKDVDLWEISLVTFPANEAAGITNVKKNRRSTILKMPDNGEILAFNESVERAICAILG